MSHSHDPPKKETAFSQSTSRDRDTQPLERWEPCARLELHELPLQLLRTSHALALLAVPWVRGTWEAVEFPRQGHGAEASIELFELSTPGRLWSKNGSPQNGWPVLVKLCQLYYSKIPEFWDILEQLIMSSL